MDAQVLKRSWSCGRPGHEGSPLALTLRISYYQCASHLVTLLSGSAGAVWVTRPGQASTFSRRLRQARERVGYSQYELGVRAGLDTSVAAPRINQYENGVHEPRQKLAQQLADALGVPSAFLYTPDEDLARLLLAWPGLSKEQRRKLAEHVESESNAPTAPPAAKKRTRR